MCSSDLLAHDLVADQYHLFNRELIPELAQAGIRFLQREDFGPKQAAWIRSYYYDAVMPVLTPIGLDPSHPFPRVLNKSLNFAVALEGKDAYGRGSGTAIVQAPRVLPRVIRLPRNLADAAHEFVLLSTIMQAHVSDLFPGMNVTGSYQFRLTRNSNLFVEDRKSTRLNSSHT